MRTELQSALGDNKQHKAENERLRARESAIDQRIQSALEGERNRLEQERNQVASDRQQTRGCCRICSGNWTALPARVARPTCPSGWGWKRVTASASTAASVARSGSSPTMPRSTPRAAARSRAFPELRAGPESLSAAVESVADVGSRAVGASTKAVYTVPSNSTLMGSIAMTALIGRVPIDGTVNDPYPFKVLIGPDNLTANGIDIPDVAGAVVSGTASGDWTLSCVRGQIRSVTFVFQDGTIRTVPEDSSKGGSSGGNSGHNGASIQGGLGWISDPYGIPASAASGAATPSSTWAASAHHRGGRRRGLAHQVRQRQRGRGRQQQRLAGHRRHQRR